MREDTTKAGPRDLPGTLARLRSRVSELVVKHGLDAHTPVGTPRFTVGESFAHLAGLVVDAAADGEPCYPAVGREALVRRHAAAWHGRSAGELAEVWEEAEERYLPRATRDGLVALIVEMTAREHDIRVGLDMPGARDDEAVKGSLDELAGWFSDRVEAGRVPPLRVTVEQWGTIIGRGCARECLVADRFEFVRAMTGRRSLAQVSRWSWSGDPLPYCALLSATGALAAQDFRERDPRVPAHLIDFDLTH